MDSLQNTKALKEILAGSHKKQTVKNIKKTSASIIQRQVGEKWIDEKGQEWEQKNGYKVRCGKLDNFRTEHKKFENCLHPECKCTRPTEKDIEMKHAYSLCLDCVTSVETKMKAEKNYDKYLKWIKYTNYTSWLENSEKEIVYLKEELKKEHSFLGENGRLEDKWTFDGSLDDVLNKMDLTFEQAKVIVKQRFGIDDEYYPEDFLKTYFADIVNKLRERNTLNEKN